MMFTIRIVERVAILLPARKNSNNNKTIELAEKAKEDGRNPTTS